MANSIHPFELLKSLVERINSQAVALPKRSNSDDAWQAVAFQLGADSLLINMNCVLEVSHQLPITPLPGVSPWIRGIANVRGEILTLIDLQALFQLDRVQNSTSKRVIAIEQGTTRLGILVDGIIGTRQVTAEQMRNTPSEDSHQAIKPCVSGAALVDDNWMGIFDPNKLVTNNHFLNLSTL